MECAAHPERTSVGYCKKCGTFGCSECLVKVSLTGHVGQKYSAKDALFCRECLMKARPDLVLPKADHPPADKPAKPRRSTHASSKEIRLGRSAMVAAVFVAVIVGFAIAYMVLPHSTTVRRPAMPPDEFASRALAALSGGDREAFLSHVDVCEFMSRMDETGLTRRDYREADRAKRQQMEASHREYLSDVLFVRANLRKQFTLVNSEIGENSASFRIKPWIAYGKRSYRRILVENKSGQWWISGLASPDF